MKISIKMSSNEKKAIENITGILGLSEKIEAGTSGNKGYTEVCQVFEDGSMVSDTDIDETYFIECLDATKGIIQIFVGAEKSFAACFSSIKEKLGKWNYSKQENAILHDMKNRDTSTKIIWAWIADNGETNIGWSKVMITTNEVVDLIQIHGSTIKFGIREDDGSIILLDNANIFRYVVNDIRKENPDSPKNDQ